MVGEIKVPLISLWLQYNCLRFGWFAFPSRESDSSIWYQTEAKRTTSTHLTVGNYSNYMDALQRIVVRHRWHRWHWQKEYTRGHKESYYLLGTNEKRILKGTSVHSAPINTTCCNIHFNRIQCPNALHRMWVRVRVDASSFHRSSIMPKWSSADFTVNWARLLSIYLCDAPCHLVPTLTNQLTTCWWDRKKETRERRIEHWSVPEQRRAPHS